MKKALKIFLPVLVIAMLVCALCVFASAEEKVYFTVTDKNGTVTEYKTDVFTSAFSDNTMKDVTVDLKADVKWGANVNLGVSGSVVINLNNYTLNMNQGNASKEGEQGRFNMNSATGTMVFNGPGKLTSSQNQARFFHGTTDKTAASGITFNNVDITAPSMLFDVRFGHLNFNNCTLTAGGYAICLAGNYNGGYNVVNMVNTTYTYTGTGHAVQTGRSNTSGPAATEFNMVNSHIVAPKASAVFKNITTLAAGSTVDLSTEIHNVTMDGKSSIVALNAQLVTSSKDGTAGGAGKHYFGTLTTVEGTVLGYNLPGIVITDPTGTQKAYLGAGQYFKYVSKDSTDVINVQYILDDVRKPVRLMLKGADLGFATVPAGTPEYNAETKTLVIKDYFKGWKDQSGNYVTKTPTEAPAEGNYVVTLDVGDVTPLWATYKTSDYTQTPVAFSVDDNNVYGKLTSTAPYLVLYGDCMIWRTDSYSAGYSLNYALYIDLNGHEFTIKSGAEPKAGTITDSSSDGSFKPGNGGALNIEGPGSFKTVNTKIAYPSGNGTVSINNCKLVLGLVHAIDCRGGNVSITNTEIDVQCSGNLISPNNNGGAQTMKFTMKDVWIYSTTGSNITAMINSPRNLENNVNDITLENVKVDALVAGGVFYLPTSYDGTLNIKNVEVNTSAAAKLFNLTNATSKLKVTIDGLKFSHVENYNNSVIKSATVTPGVPAYTGTGYTYTNTGYETQNWEVFGTKSVQYVMDGVVATCPIDTVNIPDSQGRPVFYDVKQSWLDSNVVSAVAGNTRTVTIDMEALEISTTVTWAIINKDGAITNSGATAELTKAMFGAIPSGGTLYVLDDVTYTDNTGITVADGATVDLGGNTLNISVGGSSNRLGHNSAGYTVKNGNIVLGKSSAAYIDSSSVEVTFENVNFTMTGNSLGIIDARKAKKLTVKNCTFTADNDARAFNLGYRTSTATVEIDGCTFNTPRLVAIGPVVEGNPVNMQTVNVTFTMKNSTVNSSKSTSIFADSKSLATASKLNFTFENVKFTNFNYINIANECDNLITYKSCEFKSMPTVSALANVNYSDQVIIETADTVLPYKMVNAADMPKTLANLTLYTDFVLNFYLPATATNITVNGVAAQGTAFDGMLKVACDRVSALAICDDVTVAYECTVSGYTVAMSATYSVADYAKAILSGEYDAQAKALVANAVIYVAGIYAYADVTPSDEVVALFELVSVEDHVNKLVAIPDSTADYNALAQYIDSVQLSVGTTVKYVVNFKAGFEGTVTVNGTELQVKGSEYITLRASDFADGLEITVNGVTGTYDLAAYYAGVKGTNAALDNLLVALYNYSAQAKAYVEK